MKENVGQCNANVVKNFLSDLNIKVSEKNYVLLVGGALEDLNPRDYDIIWISKDDREIKNIVNDIAASLSRLNLFFSTGEISILSMTTLKVKYLDKILSFHFVPEGVLKTAMDMCKEIDTYTKINLFSFDFCAPRVVRLWLQESLFLAGDIDKYRAMFESIKNIDVPWTAAVKYIKSQLKNCISYAREKNWQPSELGLFLLIGEIINFLILLVYFENHLFVGSKKKIDADIVRSELGRKVLSICNRLSGFISDYESLLSIFNGIESTLI